MGTKPIEWRRILTAGQRKDSPRLFHDARLNEIAVPSTVAGMGAVLQSYEHVYLENERLRNECGELRRQIVRERANPSDARSGGSDSRAAEVARLIAQLRGSVEALRQGLRALETEVTRLKSLQSSLPDRAGKTPVGNLREKDALTETPALQSTDETNLEGIAALVAEWMFPQPNAAQIRLVEDALRSQRVLDASPQ